MKQAIHRLGRAYINRITRGEFEDQRFERTNERSIEFRFVFEHLTHLQPETILDVGTGTTALPHLMRNCGFVVTAIDNVTDYWPGGMVNRHFHVIDDDIRRSKLRREFDVVTCVSVLEHIQAFDQAVDEMFRLLRPGGHLILTCPYNERRYHPNVYDAPESMYGRGSPYVAQSYSRGQLDGWLARNGAELVAQEFWQLFTGELWTFGELVRPPRPSSREGIHQLACLVLRKPS